jgi:hypothetical protein
VEKNKEGRYIEIIEEIRRTQEIRKRRAQTIEKHNRDFIKRFKNTSNKKYRRDQESYDKIAQRSGVFHLI